jgi:hypothetical protein
MTNGIEVGGRWRLLWRNEPFARAGNSHVELHAGRAEWGGLCGTYVIEGDELTIDVQNEAHRSLMKLYLGKDRLALHGLIGFGDHVPADDWMPRWHDLSDSVSLSREEYRDGFEERIGTQAK